MPRKSPKNSAATRDSMKSVIGESTDDIIRRITQEAAESILRINNVTPLGPGYSPEMAPGFFFEDIGVGFASGPKKRRRSTGGLA